MIKYIADNMAMLNNMVMLKKVVADLNACLIKNCNNKGKNMMNNKYTISANKLFEDFVNEKITIQEVIKKANELKKKIEKSKENKAIIKCTLTKCNKEAKIGIDFAIDKMLEYAPEDSMGYKFALYYNKKLRNKKLTAEMIRIINKKIREIQYNI